MTLAVMQPYFFPYLGYYQLVAAAELFVFYDDVNYIKNGWVNRNRLLLSGKVSYVTVPLAGASSFRKIYEVEIQSAASWRRKMLTSIRQSYAKAPEFEMVMPLIEGVIAAESKTIADVARRSVTVVAAYLGLETHFIETSRGFANGDLQGQARVIDICARTGAGKYLNLPGGRALYGGLAFAAAGIELCFLEPALPPYYQAHQPFEPGLSIIDVLMWNDVATVRDMISAAKVVPA